MRVSLVFSGRSTGNAVRSVTPLHFMGCCVQASFIRAILQWGGGLGGWVFSRVGGSKALDPPSPLIILRVFWVGLLPHLLSLVTGALSGCLLVPLSVVSLSMWQVCRWQSHNCRSNGSAADAKFSVGGSNPGLLTFGGGGSGGVKFSTRVRTGDPKDSAGLHYRSATPRSEVGLAPLLGDASATDKKPKLCVSV